MVYVPAGEFLMGSEDGDNDEAPEHTVFLDAFWIHKHEVTNAQYRSCIEVGELYRELRGISREQLSGSIYRLA